MGKFFLIFFHIVKILKVNGGYIYVNKVNITRLWRLVINTRNNKGLIQF